MKHEELSVGNQTQVSVNIYNTGKDNLNTFMCDVIGKGFSIDNDRKFIGNFNSGTTETFTFNITPEREGEVEGKIMLSYEDSAGNMHTTTKDFSADASNMGAEDVDGQMTEDPETGEMIPVDNGMDQNSGSSLLKSPFLSMGLIIILILIGLLLRKRKKNKKNEELIIDDEDI